jgi:hypothetical protein
MDRTMKPDERALLLWTTSRRMYCRTTLVVSPLLGRRHKLVPAGLAKRRTGRVAVEVRTSSSTEVARRGRFGNCGQGLGDVDVSLDVPRIGGGVWRPVRPDKPVQRLKGLWRHNQWVATHPTHTRANARKAKRNPIHPPIRASMTYSVRSFILPTTS